MFIELQRGYSFKGVAQYCLHDADRAKTSDRVDFVEVRNLATDNPQVAWQIMAAKHYAQDELKRKAGVGLGGPKDGKPVGHLFISWGRDEADAQNLDRSEMLYSANAALRAIGADHYPALVIAHNDTEHPHCHIVCCFIGDDGRLKKNWKEKEKLSRFALEREIAIHGEPVIKLRERNWKHRDAGETTPTKKKQPRHLYELEKAAEQDEKLRAFAEDHKAKLIDLTRRVEGQIDRDGTVVQEGRKARHKRQQERLRWCYEERNKRTKAAIEKEMTAQVRAIRQQYDGPWQELLNQHEVDRHAFRKNETTLLGRAYNVLRYTDWKAVFTKQREASEIGPSIFSRAFNTLSDCGHRQQVLAKRQQEEQDRLRKEQRRLEKAVQDRLKAEQSQQLEANKSAYARKAAAMKERQDTTKQANRLERQVLTRERNAELRAYRARVKAQKQERVQEQLVRETPDSARPIDLTSEAKRAFGVPLKQRDQTGTDGFHGPTAEPDKPKRTRKRKDPSERTNRRHTQADKTLDAPEKEQAAWQAKNWEEQLEKRYNQQRGKETENDHER
jgi:hypothetical protein